MFQWLKGFFRPSQQWQKFGLILKRGDHYIDFTFFLPEEQANLADPLIFKDESLEIVEVRKIPQYFDEDALRRRVDWLNRHQERQSRRQS